MFASGERNPAVALTEGFQTAFRSARASRWRARSWRRVLISSRDSREQAAAARRGDAPQPAAA